MIVPEDWQVWPREDRQVWLDLQRQTLERVHPSWLPSLAAELVVVARRHSAGRRFLAARLHKFAPVLLSLPLERASATGPERPAQARRLGEAAWLRTALKEPVERALDLGSHVLAPTLRTVVTRSAVAQLRTALGAERYERILAGNRPSGPSSAGARASSRTVARAVGGGRSQRAAHAPPGALRLDARFGSVPEQLIQRGAAELEAYTASVHPAFAESVRLSFHRGWWSTPPRAPSLDRAVVESCLRLASEPGGGPA